MTTKLLRARRSEEGSVLIIAAVCIVVIMGFAALSIDMGMLLTAESELQNAADAAAFAAVPALFEEDYTMAEQEALAFAQLNLCLTQPVLLSASDIQFGTYDFDQHSFVPAAMGCPYGSYAVRVVAQRALGSQQGPLPLFFGGILGFGSVDVEASTIAAVDSRIIGYNGGAVGNLLPFAIHTSQVPPMGSPFDLYPNHPNAINPSAPGNFGLLDLNSSNPGTPVLRDWIDYGYPDAVEIPPSGHVFIDGNPGLSNTLKSNVQSRIGDTVVIAVHTGVTGNGANAVYDVITLLAVEILSVTGNGTNLKITVEAEQYTSSAWLTGSGGPVSQTVAKIVLAQ